MENTLTLKGTVIPKEARGILYLCEYTGDKITVMQERIYSSPMSALNAYSNIPNPESQLATGNTYEELIKEVEEMHSNMSNPKWLEELADYL